MSIAEHCSIISIFPLASSCSFANLNPCLDSASFSVAMQEKWANVKNSAGTLTETGAARVWRFRGNLQHSPVAGLFFFFFFKVRLYQFLESTDINTESLKKKISKKPNCTRSVIFMTRILNLATLSHSV